MALPRALRRAGQDLQAAATAFLIVAALVFLAGRWQLDSPYPTRLLAAAAAAAIPEDVPAGADEDGIDGLRTQLALLGAPGAVMTIPGIGGHTVLDSVETTTELCVGCLDLIAGAAREVRSGDPVQVGVRYWSGATVLTIVADGVRVGEPRSTDLTVSLNAGGKVYFDRECTLMVETSEHAVYRTSVGEEVAELLELRAFTGYLECAALANATTGESVGLHAVFSYRTPDPGH